LLARRDRLAFDHHDILRDGLERAEATSLLTGSRIAR
jgi:hypothetical protein